MKHALYVFLLVLLLAALSGCAREVRKSASPRAGQTDSAQTEEPDQFEYHSDTEVPEGPGILTGETGEFRVF